MIANMNEVACHHVCYAERFRSVLFCNFDGVQRVGGFTGLTYKHAKGALVDIWRIVNELACKMRSANFVRIVLRKHCADHTCVIARSARNEFYSVNIFPKLRLYHSKRIEFFQINFYRIYDNCGNFVYFLLHKVCVVAFVRSFAERNHRLKFKLVRFSALPICFYAVFRNFTVNTVRNDDVFFAVFPKT